MRIEAGRRSSTTWFRPESRMRSEAFTQCPKARTTARVRFVGYRSMFEVASASVVAGRGAGLISASPSGPAQPVVDGMDGVDDQLGEQRLANAASKSSIHAWASPPSAHARRHAGQRLRLPHP